MELVACCKKMSMPSDDSESGVKWKNSIIQFVYITKKEGDMPQQSNQQV
jgi:hypothetical protein